MKKNILLVFLLAFSYPSFSQSGKIQIAFLGVFHMGETPDYKQGSLTDLLSSDRQHQISEVVESLAKFKPDKIFVENTPDTQPFWDNVYKNYQNGVKPTDRNIEYNEIYQLGIKLAKRLNHPTGVTCVNYVQPELVSGLKVARNKIDTLASFYAHELERKRPSYDAYFKANPSVNKALKDYLARYETWKNLSIKDHLLLLNSEESIATLHYFNITGWMDTNTNGYGAEFTAKEYFRNTKILQNILLRVNPADQKLLVIIGGGHIQVLIDMLKTHPYFEVVDAKTLLK
ncbi:DUF5694 domain-containing protein [Emticicia sp. BO119]|uniref:DUF5694 domain-containing protein n=1 Tax=Emticicia sp. BO119 TaxID=2757768 RepID=UPI0015F09701|nr:DUF5694 domain-containing protein [Emticicia sp. BO119]MBA4850140.1 hypothetical protein [Emticicia sp. BO119]